MGASYKSSSPLRVMRAETMSLDLGELAVVLEMDQVPPPGWIKAVEKAFSHAEGLEEATARLDGRVLYVVGLEPELRGAVQRVNRALHGVSGPTRAEPGRTSAKDAHAGHALHG